MPEYALVYAPPRFRSKVVVGEGGCWRWTGSLNWGGYGIFSVNRKNCMAHRFAFEHFVGPIPDGLTIDHLCRNRACVNPAHLEPVTGRVNTLRGYSPPAQNARKTHCDDGHEFTPENTYVYPGPSHKGERECLTCKRRWDEARRPARVFGKRPRCWYCRRRHKHIYWNPAVERYSCGDVIACQEYVYAAEAKATWQAAAE